MRASLCRSIAIALVAIVPAACGGGADSDAPSATAPATVTTGEAVRAAVAATVARLVDAGAVPDPDRASRDGVRGPDADEVLRLPAGGAGCGVREIAAGLPKERVALVAQVWAPFVAVSPEGTVALRLRTPDGDPGSPRTARCIGAASVALGGEPEDSDDADEAVAVAVDRSGVRGDATGVYYGALLRNDRPETLVAVAVGVDLTTGARGEVIGAGPPLLDPVPAIAPGAQVVVGGAATPADCGCDPRQVDGVAFRVDPAFTDEDDPGRSILVEKASIERRGGRPVAVTATLVNRGPREVRPRGTLWSAHMAFLDDAGEVIGGDFEASDARGPIEPGEALELRVRVEPSLADVLGDDADSVELGVWG